MHPALSERNVFFVKEHVGMFKAANNYDILDPETQEVLMECREERLGAITKLLRFTDYKRMTPFDVVIRCPEGRQICRVNRGWCLLLSKVSVFDDSDAPVGGFKQKLFSIGGAFTVNDVSEKPLCELKGKWTSWEFSFKHGETELARVTKKWAGAAKELFSTADNYVLEIDESVESENPVRQLILGAVMCIDMVLKE